MLRMPVYATVSGDVPFCRHIIDEVGDVLSDQTSSLILLAFGSIEVDLAGLYSFLTLGAKKRPLFVFGPIG